MRVACIGSRDLTAAQLDLCARVGAYLARSGHIVVSGGAIGADQAFARGAAAAAGDVELFVPWETYEWEQRPSAARVQCGGWGPEDWRLAALHPAWARLSRSVQRLMLRNAQIVRSSGLVVAYPRLDSSGRWTGGTRHGLLCAQDLGIEIVDLSDPKMRARVERWIGTPTAVG